MANEIRETLTCSVCQQIYTDPVTLPCGHNFCQGCIGRTWDWQKESGEYNYCPECRQEYRQKPQLKRNLRLHNIAEQFLSTHSKQDRTGIFCTFCIHSPVPAAKSCLHCEASLCESHLRGHSRSAEHVLTEPIASLGNRKCSAHNELLKYYCCEESVCVCESCCLTGEHRGHRVELMSEASEKKKQKLKNVLEKLTSEKNGAERHIHTVHKFRNEVQDIEAATIACFMETRKILEELEDSVQEKKRMHYIKFCHHSQQLEIKKEELSRKIRHIEELCNMADPLTVLQERESHGAEFCGVVVDNSDLNGNLSDGNEKKEKTKNKEHREHLYDLNTFTEKIQRHLLNELSSIVTGRKGWWICAQKATDMLVDIDSASNIVLISHDRKMTSYAKIIQGYPQTSERFQYPQTLGTRSFLSGRHYWDIEASELGSWRVGVAYPSIEKMGKHSWIGENRKSWCLRKANDIYTARHSAEELVLPQLQSCLRFRILLDYKAGSLSFYELSKPIRHLHTFTATFTEPLHAAFCVWGNAWVRIIS